MGVVYKARQVALQRLVALKMVLAGSHASPEQRGRFQAEAQGLARLQHPHIVQIYEVGEAGGQPYFSLELVEGGTLDGKLTGKPMAARQAAALVETLARAVHHAHQKGVLHRDLKPANVLLTPDGTPKIADFGLVKFVAGEGGQGAVRTAATRSGAIIGTPSYMAPEQAGAKGHAIGPPADVWALGAILYECLTGRPPFRAETPLDTILQVLSEEPVPPARLQPGLARDLDTICLKCLQKDPRKRYAGGEELADDLRRFLDGVPIRARPVGAAERLARWCRRNPAVASLVGTVALLLVAASVLSTLFAWRFNALRQEAERVAQNETAARAEAVVAARREREASDKEAQARRDAQAERARAENIVYHNSMARAAGSWQDNEMPVAEQRLDECLPELRRWEWHYLKRLCHAELETHPGPPCEPGQRVAASGDGGRWAVVRKQGVGWFRIDAWAVGIWDARAGRGLREVDPDAWAPLAAVALRPDGQRLAVARADGDIHLWDVEKGEMIRPVGKFPGGCAALAFSANGRLLAGACGDGRVRVWDGHSGKPLFSVAGPAVPLRAVAFAPDGKQLAVAAADGVVTVWNMPAPLPLVVGHWPRRVHTLAARRDDAPFLAYSPDGRRLASAGRGGTVHVWDVTAAKEVFTSSAGAAVNHLAISPDGRRLALACEDRTVRVWDAGRGRELFALRGHAKPVAYTAFRPDGTHLVSLGLDESVKVWDASSGRQALHFDAGSPRHAFSPDGRLLATVAPGQGGVTVCDPHRGRESFTVRADKSKVGNVIFSADGQRLIGASTTGPNPLGLSATNLTVWKTATREATMVPLDLSSLLGLPPGGSKELRDALKEAQDTLDKLKDKVEKLPPQERKDLPDRVAAAMPPAPVLRSGRGLATVSPGGEGVAVAVAAGFVTVLDGQTGKRRCTLQSSGMEQGTDALAFSGDGKWLARSATSKLQQFGLGSSLLQVYDATTGRVVGLCQAPVPHGHSGAVGALAFGPAGPDGEVETLATGGEDKTVKLWKVLPAGRRAGDRAWVVHQPVFTLRGHTETVRALAFSSDGQRLATVSSNEAQTAGEVKVWDAASGQELLTLRQNGTEISFSPDGRWLAVGGPDGVTLYDGSPGREFLACREAGPGVTYRPDGLRLASWGIGEQIRFWDAATGRPAGVLKGSSEGLEEGHAAVVRHAAFSPDGRLLASGDADGRVKVWDAGTAQWLRDLTGHTDAVLCVAFSPDGKQLATASADETVKVWDVDSGAELRAFTEHTDRVQAVTFAPDGVRVASAGDDRTVRLWDSATGRETVRLVGHEDFVNAVAFSPDGSRLASAGEDSAVRIWDTATGKEVHKLLGHSGGVRAVAFSPDGSRLATAGWEGRVKLWDAATGKELLDIDGRGGGMVTLSFSPDGRRLAASGAGNTARVWDVAP
jgi:WD40 repeat protein